MTTLAEYATAHFPNHVTDQSGDDMTLTDHTAVAHVVGSANGIELARRVRAAAPNIDVGAIMVRPADQTVVTDRGSVGDLPHRRVGASGIVGTVLIGLGTGLIVSFVSGSAMVGVIIGVLAGLLGCGVSAIAEGEARAADQRAFDQPHAPDRTVAVVAAFTSTEGDAVAATRVMDEMDPYEVRIVASDGAWHTPNA